MFAKFMTVSHFRASKNHAAALLTTWRFQRSGIEYSSWVA